MNVSAAVFFILFHLLVNYLSCTSILVIKNKKHCVLDLMELMEMVLWLLSARETLVTYIISNYMCSFLLHIIKNESLTEFS